MSEFDSILLGLAASAANAIVAAIAYAFAFRSEPRQALQIVVMSIVARVLLIAAGLFILFRSTDVAQVPFSVAFCVSAFIFIIIEIFIMNYHSNSLNLKKKKNSEG
mgnify:CR=1 FL=1